MSRQINSGIKPQKLAVWMAAIPMLMALPLLDSQKLVVAQSPTAPSFTIPSTLPNGSVLRIDGASNMVPINTVLEQQFQAQFPNTDIKLGTNGTTAALQALVKNEVDLAAIGRGLTAGEKAQGLKEIVVNREKIAIIVGANNPFAQSITAEEFAQIFRGEIKDWSELGGPAGPIRFIDRPESSDTRQALSQYPMFQSAPFKAGANATPVAEDTTEAVIQQLGKDGISYAIASQITGRNEVKALPLYGILPTGANYAFSQPRGYAYKENASPQTQAFLGYVTSSAGQAAIANAPNIDSQTGAVASPAPGVTGQIVEAPPSAAPSQPKPFPWWWLMLPFLGLAALLAWLMRGQGAPVAVGGEDSGAKVTLIPRNCRTAQVTWEMPPAVKKQYAERGGRSLALRLYDVTAVEPDQKFPPHCQQVECNADTTAQALSIDSDDRDYVVELGYLTDNGDWLRVARSQSAHIPACPTEEKIRGAAAAAVAGSPQMVDNIPWQQESVLERWSNNVTPHAEAAPAAVQSLPEDLEPATESGCRIILVPRNANEAYAYWEVAEQYKAIVREQGGQNLQLRIHDVTNIDLNQTAPHSTQVYPCTEQDRDRLVRLPAGDRNYVAELGYVTADDQWLLIIRSLHVHVPNAMELTT